MKMAAHERLLSDSSIAHITFTERLAKALPRGATFKLYHVSTPPSRTEALYSAPPGQRPDRTYCESNFLAVSINANPSNSTDEVLVFAIEILIYSTAYSTTLFVSKADSSGYLHLLNLPKGSPSPLKEISATFLAYLVDQRKRPGIPTVVSLFARAQDQYLFPRSIRNKGKHVLDDRGLVRWWCRILDPLLHSPIGNESPFNRDPLDSIHGYLTVPGLDAYDAKSLLPKTRLAESWTIGHPLTEISRHAADVPPRCLIPHFPDDPKARFLDELDDELKSSQEKGVGQWKSVKTLDQFWEMMAFRQECSAGRLVGFIWVVLKPKSPIHIAKTMTDSQNSSNSVTSQIPDLDDDVSDMPILSQTTISPNTSPSKSRRGDFSNSDRFLPPTMKKLSGTIIPRQPRVKTKTRSYETDRPSHTAYYSWPENSRGQVVLEEKDYKRMNELLLVLDFANLDLAREGTARWTNEVLAGASMATNSWGASVTGTKHVENKGEVGTAGVATLNMNLVKKKRKAGAAPEVEENGSAVTEPAAPQPNILGASMIRKKVKI